jgi:arsenite-transporting ATPase
VPILRLDLFKDEVLGVKDLVEVGRRLYGDKDPADIYYGESAYRFRKVDGNYQLRVKLPFVTGDEIQLHKRFNELVIRIGGFKRHLQLPQGMAHTEPLGAKVAEGNLLITFGGKDAGTKKARAAKS